MSRTQVPLSYEASTTTRPRVSENLPREVVNCLENARFLHLATCDAETPHVSLMSYTYLSSTPFSNTPTIIMTTNPVSQKTHNLLANPRVSLLVHDWVSHRPPTHSGPTSQRDGSPPAQRAQSSLAAMLANINSSALSRISATINGSARIVEPGSEEEIWCKEQHLQNNTFNEQMGSSADLFGTSPGDQNLGDGGRGCFIEGEAVRVVVVKIKDGRIADWKGSVKDWAIAIDGDSDGPNVVNGTRE